MSTASVPSSLVDLGWDADWEAALAVAASATVTAGATDGGAPLAPGRATETAGPLTPGRVSRIDRGISTVLTAVGPVRVAAVTSLPLAVGDWVTLAASPLGASAWVLAGLLPRRSAFRRVTDNAGAREQIVAANIDTVLIVDAVDGQLSARHLERYVALAWQSGAEPVVVITKVDLAPPEAVARHAAEVHAVATDVAVLEVSATTGVGLDRLAPYLGAGRTVALLGLSGAGKSTLVNLLAGEEVLATGAVRGDGKGRHTTTYRELVPLPGRGMLIDTPGMRALSVAAATEGVAQVFSDLEALARGCEFDDCSHTSERNCAVTAAVAEGLVTEERLASWRQLQLETPADTPQVARRRIVERKKQKKTAKAGRARTRALARKPAAPPSK